jgi:hypothetical protein
MRSSSRAASLAVLLLAGSALAEDSAQAPPASEEMIVTSESLIARRRQAVINNLKALGYRKKKTEDGRTTYSPTIPWKPTVIVDDDAYIILKRTPVRIDPPGERGSKLRYLWCLPPFTITKACIQTSGMTVGTRKLAHAKETVVRATHPELRRWRAAVIAKAMDKRVNTEVPDLLDDIWERGLPAGEDGPRLLDPAERRAAILQLWSSRSCTPEGAKVRTVVADFVRYEVQASDTPASTEEIAQANAANPCDDKLPPAAPGQLDGPVQSE